ncbi:hypothetical protein [Microvirga sp. TS319]|uniref:hypothetical protein n=1 Tax=Microvirga sp. TS319 TaxID=3241165 RepID=UPI00351A9B6E
MNIGHIIRARWKEQARSCRYGDFDSIVTLATEVANSSHSTLGMQTAAHKTRSNADVARTPHATEAERRGATDSFIHLKGELGALWDLI